MSDADLARVLLRGPDFNDGKSGFFGALLPSRSAQVDVGRAVRDIVRAHVSEYRDRPAVAVARRLGSVR
ncbi:hypothetical protein [Saccharothrix deserti]|uniref:hypothetical protein n=1 Tax=Saccharothrix deserti TaxID=2593674 RepID=UPI00131B9DCF|nr:hypothetical protein [Saccharothrix deserti]